MICETCGKQHNGTYGSGRFCSRKCANTRHHSADTKEKIRNSLCNYNKEYQKTTSQKRINLCIDTVLEKESLPNELWGLHHENSQFKFYVSTLGRYCKLYPYKYNISYGCKKTDGYMYDGHMYAIHRYVLETFSPQTEEDIRLGRNQVDHINTITDDNRLENLRWVTNQENCNNSLTIKHRIAANMLKHGCGNPISKFIPKDIIDIYKLYFTNSSLISEISKMYNTSTTTIRSIVNGKTYKEIYCKYFK